MKLSSRVAVALLLGATLECLCVPSARSQIRQIDSSKIPQNSSVQAAYQDLLPIDQFARTYEANWHFPVSKADVVSRFEKDLHILENAQQLNPENTELQVLTGLVAHLAYNLGIEEAYGPALSLLQPLAKDDFRADWFLGAHQCQSNDPIGGMQRFLHVEASSDSLSTSFWLDYAGCAETTNMPVHAIRAYDNAQKLNDGTPIDAQQEQQARDKIKPSSVAESYPVKQAWNSERVVGGNHYTSTICGESFAARLTLHVTISNVTRGTCPITIGSDAYPSRYGPSSASLLLLTQVATPGESLETYAKRILEAFSQHKLKDPFHTGKSFADEIKCPVASCLYFDMTTDKLYKNEGGAHLVAVFFQSQQPDYPGLRFETPHLIPKTAKNSIDSAQPDESLQRFNGTLYTFLTLDANHDIYPRSRKDFDELLKSIVVDSKIEVPAP